MRCGKGSKDFKDNKDSKEDKDRGVVSLKSLVSLVSFERPCLFYRTCGMLWWHKEAAPLPFQRRRV
jgi:hypothetical protein